MLNKSNFSKEIVSFQSKITFKACNDRGLNSATLILEKNIIKQNPQFDKFEEFPSGLITLY